MANTHFFEPLFLLDNAPAPEITEICRLHNKIYTDYDFFDQWTTTIYSGIAYWLWNEGYYRISQLSEAKGSRFQVRRPF